MDMLLKVCVLFVGILIIIGAVVNAPRKAINDVLPVIVRGVKPQYPQCPHCNSYDTKPKLHAAPAGFAWRNYDRLYSSMWRDYRCKTCNQSFTIRKCN